MTCSTGWSQPSSQDFINLGKKLVEEKKLDSAIVLFELASNQYKKDGNLPDFMAAQSYVIDVHTELGRYEMAGELGESLLDSHADFFEKNTLHRAMFYNVLGRAYYLHQGDNNKGKSYLKRSIDLLSVYHNDNLKLISEVNFNLAGSFYFNTEYDSSIIYFKKAIEKYVPAFGSKNAFIGECYRGIGNDYWGLEKLEEADKYFQMALNILTNLEGNYSSEMAKVLHSRGYLLIDLKNYSAAAEIFKKASKLYEEELPSIHPRMIWIYGDIGRALFLSKSYDSALLYYQKALISDIYGFENMDVYVNPELKNINDEFQFFMVLKLKAQAFAEKYLSDGDPKDAEIMQDTYDKTEELVRKFRTGLTNISDHAFLNFTAQEIYSQAFNYRLKFYEKEESPEHLKMAHEYLEKQKLSHVHRTFMEASAKANIKLDKDLIEQESTLKTKITTLKSQLLEMYADNSDSVEIVQQSLFNANRELEKLILALERDKPEYYLSKYNFDVINLDDTQRSLSQRTDSTAIITYFVWSQKIHVGVITKDSVSFYTEDLTEDLNELISNFRSSIIDLRDDYEQYGEALSEVLIQRPFETLKGQNIGHLVIIPDRSIQLLPFEILKVRDDQNQNEKYLFEHFAINYQYSVTLFDGHLNGAHAAQKEFLGLAPSFEGYQKENSEVIVRSSINGLYELPGAQSEVKQIAEVMGGESLLNNSATEENLKVKSKNVGLLHLATHAVVDEKNPENSYLAFSEVSEQNEDGKLYFFEIYNLKLQASLVTLSTCNSGFGKVKIGEGVMSLSRAFAYAGVPATAVSLWPASDKSTPDLMKYFYQNLKKGLTKDVALNKARRQYFSTATGKARHPFYWGGFVLIGDNSSIDNNSSSLATLMAFLFFITILPLILVVKKKYLSID